LLKPYPLKELDEYSFGFTTDQEISYVIYFLDYSAMFSEYPELAANIYMFNIDVTEGGPDLTIADNRIGVTILDVFNIFFKSRHNVAVYVCDSLDDRQLARKRKFDIWFWKYNDGSLIKEDDVAVVEGVEIYNSMILHKQNNHLIEIILAYKELNQKTSDK
jgi:hypothetical protein